MRILIVGALAWKQFNITSEEELKNYKECNEKDHLIPISSTTGN